MIPVVQRISDVLFKRLQRLSAGYSQNTRVREVIRPKKDEGFTPSHAQIVLIQGDPVLVNYRQGSPPAVTWDQVFKIYCHVDPSELDETPSDEFTNYMVADVMDVVTKPAASWHNFQSLAINSRFFSPEHILDSEPITGAMVPLVIQYRTSEVDQYVVRA